MKKIYKILGILFCLAFGGVIFVSYHFYPLFNNFPMPSGSFGVGQVRYHWTDKQGQYESEVRRRINVDIFYPSQKTKDSKQLFEYQPQKLNGLAEGIAEEFSFVPSWLVKFFLQDLKSYAEPNAFLSLSSPTWPVIIYLPGIGGIDQHNLYLEELASHGYIVLAIEPPYDTFVTVFPENEVIRLSPILKNAMDRVDRKVIYEYRDQAHVRWSKYITFVIRQLRELNKDEKSVWNNRLDLSRLGVMGHSHGGAVALDFCQKNKICKAGINMGWLDKNI